MLSGVGKSGSPISRWTMLRPWASRPRAFASTSKAPSVPRLFIRSAKRIDIFPSLENRPAGGAVDDDGLAADVGRAGGTQESTQGAQFGRVSVAFHGQRRRAPLELLVDRDARLLRRALR